MKYNNKYKELALKLKDTNTFELKMINEFIDLSTNKNVIFIEKLANYLKINHKEKYIKYMLISSAKNNIKRNEKKEIQRQLIKTLKKENKEKGIKKREENIKEKENYKKEVKKMYSKIYSQKD